MIYLDNLLQKKLLALFHYVLLNNGRLVLGKSESISAAPELFAQEEKKYKVFLRKKEAVNQAVFDLEYRVQDRPLSSASQLPQAPLPKVSASGNELEALVQAALLKDFVPASVLINRHMDIIMSNGPTS